MTDKTYDATQLIEALAEVDAPALCEKYDRGVAEISDIMNNSVFTTHPDGERARLAGSAAQAAEALKDVSDVFIEEVKKIGSPSSARSAARTFCDDIHQR